VISLSLDIGISDGLDIDLNHNFGPTGGVSWSRNESLVVDGIYSYTFLIFPIISNKIAVLRSE